MVSAIFTIKGIRRLISFFVFFHCDYILLTTKLHTTTPHSLPQYIIFAAKEIRPRIFFLSSSFVIRSF